MQNHSPGKRPQTSLHKNSDSAALKSNYLYSHRIIPAASNNSNLRQRSLISARRPSPSPNLIRQTLQGQLDKRKSSMASVLDNKSRIIKLRQHLYPKLYENDELSDAQNLKTESNQAALESAIAASQQKLEFKEQPYISSKLNASSSSQMKRMRVQSVSSSMETLLKSGDTSRR